MDFRFVLVALFTLRLSERDDANRIFRAFRKCDKGNSALNHPDSDPSSLTIVLTRVGTNQKSPAKDFFGFGEVEPVFSDIRPVLGLIPLELNCNSICSYSRTPFMNNALGPILSVMNVTIPPEF
jgi:hypothetical protein